MKKWSGWLFFGYTIAVIIISVIPVNSGGSSLSGTNIVSIRLDYLLHGAIFFVWGILMLLYCKLDNNRGIAWFYLLGILLAIGTEYVQRYLPYRGYNVNDMLGNLIGIGAAGVGYLGVKKVLATEAHREKYTSRRSRR